MPSSFEAEDLPALAIIITCWNYEEYVTHAIRSVLAQQRDDCELVVIDDGSTDASWKVIESLDVRAYRIENCGQRMACLFGLAHTTAPFVLFLDADDELEQGAIDEIISWLDRDVAKLQFCLRRIQFDQPATGDLLPKPMFFREREALARRILGTGTYPTPPTSGNVFRRDVCLHLEDAGYDDAVDGIMLFAAPFLGDVVALPSALGKYRVHDRNNSGLGRSLDPQILRKEMSRYVARMDHLRRILQTLGRSDQLVAPDETYFFLERSFYLHVAEGGHPPITHFLRLLRAISRDEASWRKKTGLGLFHILMWLLPNRRACNGLSYRLNGGGRSSIGLLRALMR